MNRLHPPEETQAVFRRIAGAVPTRAAAERYGLRLNAQGFCRCPFHQEDTPSLKVYPGDRGFYCFGCGAGGDVITLTARLLGLPPAAAARRLDEDFALGVFQPAWPQTTPHSGAQAGYRPAAPWDERAAARAAQQERLDAISGALRLLGSLPRPAPGQHRYAAQYARLLALAGQLEEERDGIYERDYLQGCRDALHAGGLSDPQRAVLRGLPDQEPV